MTKTYKNKTRTKNGKRSSKSYAGGDIPPPGHFTHTTASCPLPRVSESCTVRGTATAIITATPTTDVKTNFNFQMALANVGVGFWDQYRIEAIRFVVSPQNNAIGLVTNSTTSLVPLYIVIDYDDATSLTNSAAAMAYSNCVVLHPGESCERIFKPRVALAAYNGTFGGYAVAADTWIDCQSTSVQHYGIKTLIPGVTAAQTLLQSWDISVEYFIQFRKSI